MDKPTLHLLMGLPGSGKTTLGKVLQKITDGARFSSDDYRLMVFPDPKFTQQEHDNLYGLIDHNVEHILEYGRSVVYDANLNRRHHREEKYALAKKYDINVTLWWVQVPPAVAKKRRCAEQNPKLIPEGETSENMFDRIAELIEEPNESEPYINVDGTKISEKYIRNLLNKA